MPAIGPINKWRLACRKDTITLKGILEIPMVQIMGIPACEKSGKSE
jgi:hypothetical protein